MMPNMLGYWRHMDVELQPYKDVDFFIGALEVTPDAVRDVPVFVSDVMVPREGVEPSTSHDVVE